MRKHFRGLFAAAFIGVLVLAFGLRLGVAIKLPSLVWPDEIFQTMEQAHRLVFGYGIVPWEFRAGARSWLFPGLLAGAMELGRPFGGHGYIRAVQVMMALLSLVPVAVAFIWAYRRHGLLAAIIASVASAAWFELVYFSTRTLTEVVAAHVVVTALYLGSVEKPQKRQRLLLGVAFGLAAVLRIHLIPAIAVVIGMLCRRSSVQLRNILTGVALPVVGAGLLDLLTWSGFLSSFLLYFQYNIVEGNSVNYGVQAWHWYFTRIADIWSWGTPVVLGLALIGAIRYPLAAAFAVVALLTHSVLAHKEYRFVYPVILVIVLLASQGLAEVYTRLAAVNRVRQVLAMGAAVLIWVAISSYCASRFQSDGSDGLARSGESIWRQKNEGLVAMAAIGADPGVCAVGLVSVSWGMTGGYTYLHRNVPIYLIPDWRMFHSTSPAFNTALAPRGLVSTIPGFKVEQCWDSLCIVKRQGTCSDVGAEKINDVLSRFGA